VLVAYLAEVSGEERGVLMIGSYCGQLGKTVRGHDQRGRKLRRFLGPGAKMADERAIVGGRRKTGCRSRS